MLRKIAHPQVYKTTVRRMAGSDAAAATESSNKKAVLQLVRFDPENNHSRVESYEYDKHHNYMVLDLLTAVKAHQDPTLAFRASCCEGVCGSCAMNINGVNSLACVTFASEHTTVGPLPNFPVIKDFVVDLRHFFGQYAFIRPFVRNANLHRNQINGIVERYNNVARLINGVSPKEGAILGTKERQHTVITETEVISLLRIADALCASGNVTHLISTLRKMEACGVELDNAKTIQLIEEALKNHSAAAGKSQKIA